MADKRRRGGGLILDSSSSSRAEYRVRLEPSRTGAIASLDPQQLALFMELLRPTPAPSLTFFELATWWRAAYLPRLASRRSREVNITHLEEEIGGLTEETMTADVLELALARLEKGRKLGPQSLNHIRTAGRKLVQDAIRSKKWVGPNPWAGVVKREVPRRVQVMLTPFEAAQLIGGATPRYRPFIATLLYIALRPGEARGLRVGDVDLARATVVVRSSGHRATTKTGRERLIPIPAELLPWLVHQIAGRTNPNAPVFGRKDGKFRGPNFRACNTVRNGLVRAGLSVEGASARWLRHVSCTMHQEAGCHPWVVSRVLGHGGDYMTARYTHLSLSTVRAELNKLHIPAVPPQNKEE